MFCKSCGKELPDGTKFCPDCGTSQNVTAESSDVSKRSRAVAALLAFFLGALGIHRFYVGKTGTGILQILLTFCFGIGAIWAFIDFIMIVCGAFRDKEGLLITEWDMK